MPPKKAPAAKAAAKPAAKKTTAAAGTSKTGQKKAAPAKSKAASSSSHAAAATKGKPAPAAKTWTKEDTAARVIQTQVRKFLAKVHLEKKKKEKQEYEELMDKLEKEAFVQLVKMEQEQAERERQKEEEERKQKRELIKRRKRMLDAAFDGDIDAVQCIFTEVKALDDKAGIGTDVIGRAVRNKNLLQMVDCEDANENTPLSEASSGGHADMVRLLLNLGANINKRGQFGRTPLYRAAYAGHLEVAQTLLQHGADPRIYADDGQTPHQIATLAPVQELLEEWDIELTESLLVKLEEEREKRREEERQRREAETSNIQARIELCQKDYQAAQRRVMKATEELNKRIFEHDSAAVLHGKVKTELTLQVIHDAEFELESAKIDLDKTRTALSLAKTELRQQHALSAEETGEDLPGIKVLVKELDEVLMRDVGNTISNSGKWPLIIDQSGQAATFLRYRDTNYVNALSPAQMEAGKLRFSLLGAIRYGKPFVLDMMEVDMFETCSMRFDEITPGLMSWIMDKSITKEERYLKLLKPNDPPEYDKNNFNEQRTSRFQMFIVTKNPFPPESLVDSMFPIRVSMPS